MPKSVQDEPLDEDELIEKVPKKYAQYLEDDNFEKLATKHKEWD